MNTASTSVPPTTSPWVAGILERIDNVIQDRVLVYGSLPPEGGDVDILARPTELVAIRMALIAAGFVPIRRMLVRFRKGACDQVELTTTDAWRLPPDELDTLFAEAEPLDGTERLVRPSAHHALLIRARKVVQRPASLQKLHSRIGVLLAEEPDAWRRADAHAPAWRAREALSLLKIAYERNGHAPALARWNAIVEQSDAPSAHRAGGRAHMARAFVSHLRLPHMPRFRRTRVIAFSGLDGSGKSSQARLLRDALLATGQDARVIWAGIGTNRSLGWIKTPVKRGLRALPRIGPLKEIVDRVTPRPDGKHTPLAEPGRRERRRGVGLNLVTQVWLTIMALVNVYSMRKVLLRSFGRGRIIIFDRYTLDSAVRLRHWYGDSLATKLVIRLIHLLAKRPIKTYFLDVPPQVAFDRKPEWELDDLECRAALYRDEYARLGVRRLDGTRPAEELFAEIAADVWSALR